jgi:methylated-DNA-[protein]-cysteine S-methyltransferase
MQGLSFTLFDSAIGRCGIGWGEQGIACVQLPEANARETQRRVCAVLPGARLANPTDAVRNAIDGIVSVLEGEPTSLSFVQLDMRSIPPFHQRVYEVTRRVPPGATVTYGDIAIRLGAPGAARAVGRALGRNPFAIIVPCHRVLAANGKLCGFSAHGGTATKLRLLRIEGIIEGPLFSRATRSKAAEGSRA